MVKPVVITIGDPLGIGPEIIAKIPFENYPIPIVIIGDKDVALQAFKKYAGNNMYLMNIPVFENFDDIDTEPAILNISNKCNDLDYLNAGYYSYKYVEKAIDLALQNKTSAIVTAPINKENWAIAGIKYKGHTGLLQERSESKVAMAFYSDKLNVILETIHIPLKDVSKKITTESILYKIKLANQFLNKLGIKCPTIAVAGLNPHAGENGLLGKEDNEIIKPAVKLAVKENINVIGPLPADTLFYKSIAEKEINMIVAMYHDQGLAPLKMIGLHDAVNITLGLPFIRTSPDHGTAFDIAGKGIANPNSMIHALDLAVKLIS